MKDKLLSPSRFPWLLGFSALFIALCAACFSVYGIATLFAGATISVIIMASSLEIGKLVGTTFLYRYWSKCQKFLKTYLVVAILVLMVITSLGIFGYLSAAYQKSSIEFSVTQEKIKNTESQKGFYQDKITASKKRMDDLAKLRSAQESRMSEVLTNEFLSRNPLQLKQLQQQTLELISQTDKDMKDENDKVQASIEEIRKTDGQVNQLKMGAAGKKDVQTFKFVADAMGLPLDTVARWFIISIIFVFDPLAICLILAYNVAVYRKEDVRVYGPPEQTHTPQPVETKILLNDSKSSETFSETPIIPEDTPIAPTTESIQPSPIVEPTSGFRNNGSSFFKQYFKT